MENVETISKTGGGDSVQSNVPVRENMVATAVNFLQNPKVVSSPEAQKRKFLAKKGLTNEEIDLAFKRISFAGNQLPYQHQALVRNEGVYIHQTTVWSRINRYGTTVIIIGIALYGLHRFYKLYIEPLLFGSQKRDRLAQLDEQLLEVNRTLSQLKRSMTVLEESILLQDQYRKRSQEFEQAISPSFFLELKTDVTTVKSLLLNRHQFPEVPKLSPSIPSWQLVSSAGEKTIDVGLDDSSLSEKESDHTNTSSEENKKEEEDASDIQQCASEENVEEKHVDDGENSNCEQEEL